ncbi:MAG TPA: aldo/keto reductase [Polyangia bacterium]|jgi:aryl-alcohol dehydrogenase-like predicted oxidoreductase|nr:aldo/keto reductase [Polyangia bacterium]
MSDELSKTNNGFAPPPPTLRLGDLEVFRLGYGAMRLPGRDVWGEPDDPARARAVLRRVIELGINFIDTSWYYGPYVANRLIAEALHPYPKDLVIATKLGGKRLPDKSWAPFARPEELRQGCEEDLRTLRIERCDVTHFRYMPGAGVPFRESLDAMIELQREGKIRHLALSNVGTAELLDALERTPIVAVQNLYNVSGGLGPLARWAHAEVEAPDAVLDACEARGIAYLPFFPLAVGHLGQAHPALARAASRHGATPAQIALAWLLWRSPVMLPIPGTGSIAHLEENWAARRIALTREEAEAIAQEARATAAASAVDTIA